MSNNDTKRYEFLLKRLEKIDNNRIKATAMYRPLPELLATEPELIGEESITTINRNEANQILQAGINSQKSLPADDVEYLPPKLITQKDMDDDNKKVLYQLRADSRNYVTFQAATIKEPDEDGVTQPNFKDDTPTIEYLDYLTDQLRDKLNHFNTDDYRLKIDCDPWWAMITIQPETKLVLKEETIWHPGWTINFCPRQHESMYFVGNMDGDSQKTLITSQFKHFDGDVFEAVVHEINQIIKEIEA